MHITAKNNITKLISSCIGIKPSPLTIRSTVRINANKPNNPNTAVKTYQRILMHAP